MKDINYMNTLWHKVDIAEKNKNKHLKSNKMYISIVSIIFILSLVTCLAVDGLLQNIIYPLSVFALGNAVYIERTILKNKEQSWS